MMQVAEAEKNLRAAQRDLGETKAQLAALNAQLMKLREQFGQKTAELQVPVLVRSCSQGEEGGVVVVAGQCPV